MITQPFIVRNRTGRHFEHAVSTKAEAESLMNYFKFAEPEAKCYVIVNPLFGPVAKSII